MNPAPPQGRHPPRFHADSPNPSPLSPQSFPTALQGLGCYRSRLSWVSEGNVVIPTWGHSHALSAGAQPQGEGQKSCRGPESPVLPVPGLGTWEGDVTQARGGRQLSGPVTQTPGCP